MYTLTGTIAKASHRTVPQINELNWTYFFVVYCNSIRLICVFRFSECFFFFHWNCSRLYLLYCEARARICKCVRAHIESWFTKRRKKNWHDQSKSNWWIISNAWNCNCARLSLRCASSVYFPVCMPESLQFIIQYGYMIGVLLLTMFHFLICLIKSSWKYMK